MRLVRRSPLEGWLVDAMPDLNPHLARYLIQNTLWWIEYAGLSGIREDTFGYGDAGRWKLGMAYLATVRGIPQFYYGSEVLLRGPKQRDDGRLRADMPGG